MKKNFSCNKRRKKKYSIEQRSPRPRYKRKRKANISIFISTIHIWTDCSTDYNYVCIMLFIFNQKLQTTLSLSASPRGIHILNKINYLFDMYMLLECE